MMFYVWPILMFLLGACVGSFINFCFYRLPLEKSLLWPGPRCDKCCQPIRWLDCLPLVSYVLLRGRCRTCGAAYSVRHPFVEVVSGLLFAGLFYLEIDRNILDIPFLRQHHVAIMQGQVPGPSWLVFAAHAVLVSFLLLTSLCDLDDMAIPLQITVAGTLVGLGIAVLGPWPYPNTQLGPLPLERGLPPQLPAGLYPWPVVYPLPDWLPAGSWQLGLATGLAGAVAGMVSLRLVRFLFGLGRGIEGLGMGDADLMMMAGAFVGWQPILISFFVGVFPGLFFGIVQLVRHGDQALPYGPSLAIGVVLTLLFWPFLGSLEMIRLLFFVPWMLPFVGGSGLVLLLIMGFLLRLLRGTPPDPAAGD
jgi:leader peptidase (prepilin peptidase)/N-methyltransferase